MGVYLSQPQQTFVYAHQGCILLVYTLDAHTPNNKGVKGGGQKTRCKTNIKTNGQTSTNE